MILDERREAKDEKVSGMGMYKLGDLCSDVVDCPHSTPEWKNEGIRVIRNFNIVNGSLDFSNGFFVDEETFEKRTQRACPEFEDLVISREAPMGAVCMIPKNLKCCLGQRLVLLKVNKDVADPNYILFAIQSQFVQKQIQIIDQTGSIVSNLNIPDLKSLRIPLPSLPEQKKIASVLSALDDKIALNKKMNQKLEAMAKRLYDYWFVQYDFPDKNGHPYKTTGGKMEYNPTLKREIPVGWEVKQICDITKIFNGSTPSTTEEGNYGGEIVWITPKDLSDQNCKFVYQGARNITQAGYDSCSTTMVPKGTVVMSSRAPIGLLSIAQCDLCTNQGFKNMVPNDMTDSRYLYYTIQQHIPQIQNLGTGTTFKEVSKDELGRFAILYPPKKLIATFEEKMAPIFDVQFNKVKEITRLTALRDKLLPLLMNGQVVID